MMQERKLTARSVIASTLLGSRPPRLPAAVLVRAGSLFAISEGSIRTALSRMTASGELEVADGSYQLAGALLARARRQEESRLARPPSDWNGDWHLVVVSGEGARTASARAGLRLTLGRAHFAELREGVWVRPADTVPPTVDGCTWFVGHPTSPTEGPTTLARQLWPLDSWAQEAMQLIVEIDRWHPALDRRDPSALAATFVLDAAVIRHLQADPLLPAELLPATWPGDRLRASYERFDASFKATWRLWYRAQPETR